MEITVQSKYFGIATVGEVLQQRRKITLRLPSARMGKCEAQLPYRCRGKQGSKQYPAVACVGCARLKLNLGKVDKSGIYD